MELRARGDSAVVMPFVPPLSLHSVVAIFSIHLLTSPYTLFLDIGHEASMFPSEHAPLVVVAIRLIGNHYEYSGDVDVDDVS